MRTGTKTQTLLIVLSVICLALLFLGGPSSYSPRSAKCLWDLGHIFTFGLWTYLTIQLFPKTKTLSFGQLSFIMLAGAALLGALTEFAQHWADGRTPSYSDFSKDILGCALALAFSATAKKLSSVPVKALFRSLVIFILCWQLWPLTKALIDERIAVAQFPVIADFETPFEIDRWIWHEGNSAAIVKDDAFQGEHSLKVTLRPGRYSGLSLKHFPGNWQGFRHFELDVKNPLQENISLTCRIHDKKHRANGQQYTDRFNQSFTIEPGWQHISIKKESITTAPQGREMDITNITGVGLFASNLQRNKTVYIDNVRLSK